MSVIRLPDIRNNFIFHPLLIFAIALQALFQNGFFVADALGDEGDIEQHDEEGEGRSQHQRHGEEEDNGGRVHRVSDDTI